MSELGLKIRPSRPAIGRLGGGVHFLVRAEPPGPPAGRQRPPVAFALVIDRSGSMACPAASAGGRTWLAGRAARPGRPPSKLGFVKAAALDVVDLSGDLRRVGRRIESSRSALDEIERRYGATAAAGPPVARWREAMSRLAAAARARSIGSREVKARYAASHRASRARLEAPE